MESPLPRSQPSMLIITNNIPSPTLTYEEAAHHLSPEHLPSLQSSTMKFLPSKAQSPEVYLAPSSGHYLPLPAYVIYPHGFIASSPLDLTAQAASDRMLLLERRRLMLQHQLALAGHTGVPNRLFACPQKACSAAPPSPEATPRPQLLAANSSVHPYYRAALGNPQVSEFAATTQPLLVTHRLHTQAYQYGDAACYASPSVQADFEDPSTCAQVNEADEHSHASGANFPSYDDPEATEAAESSRSPSPLSLSSRETTPDRTDKLVITDRDVLCGKGGRTLEHNKFFTEMCAEYAEEYSQTTKRGPHGKRGIAMQIIERVKADNGRFLTMQGNEEWVEMGHKKILEKVGHCLRDLVSGKGRVPKSAIAKKAIKAAELA